MQSRIHTAGVAGSIPAAPTIFFKGLRFRQTVLFGSNELDSRGFYRRETHRAVAFAQAGTGNLHDLITQRGTKDQVRLRDNLNDYYSFYL